MTTSKVIKQKIDQLLKDQAASNELKLAYVRSLIFLVSAIADTIVFFFPQATLNQAHVSPRIALTTLGIALLSLGITWYLRQKYTPVSSLWLSLIDGTIVFLVITGLAEVLGATQPLIVANITAFCAVLAVSGAIRLSKQAVTITTGLALINFAYGAWLFQLPIGIAIFAGISIGTAGFLGGWIAQIVQRQVKNEVGRLMMERLLPQAVVRSAFDDPSGFIVQPRLCEVTVMVTDIRGFTSFAEGLSPAEVLAFLNRFQGLLASIVQEYGGMVDKFMGDGMLAVFGAPDPLPNHSEQAIKAALVMLDSIGIIGAVRLGIGIHSGKVVAGCLGNDDHLEFTVIGDTVNVASRLESLCKELNQALVISGTTVAQVQGKYPWRSLGVSAIRGRAQSLEIFTLPNSP
jgi:class 3 adenylate cyclase